MMFLPHSILTFSIIYFLQLQKSSKRQPIHLWHSLHFNPAEAPAAPHLTQPAANHHRSPSYPAIKDPLHPPSPVKRRPQHNHLLTTLPISSSRVLRRSLRAYMHYIGNAIAIVSSEKNRTARSEMQHEGIKNGLRRRWRKRGRNKRERG